ncbi:hypothetical protein MKEN_00940500 [Mycena kentingensis (nom. inval.)]|nr:hypothetical protein MKEN_00940500 [Mycena kentingensis (nom. inval.)]
MNDDQDHQLRLEIRYLSSALHGRTIRFGLGGRDRTPSLDYFYDVGPRLGIFSHAAALLAAETGHSVALTGFIAAPGERSSLIVSVGEPSSAGIPQAATKDSSSGPMPPLTRFETHASFVQQGLQLLAQRKLTMDALHRRFLQKFHETLRGRLSMLAARWDGDILEILGTDVPPQTATYGRRIAGNIFFPSHLAKEVRATVPGLLPDEASEAPVNPSTFSACTKLVGICLRRLGAAFGVPALGGTAHPPSSGDLDEAHTWICILFLLQQSPAVKELFRVLHGVFTPNLTSQSTGVANYDLPPGNKSSTFHSHLGVIVSWFAAIFHLSYVRGAALPSEFLLVRDLQRSREPSATDRFRSMDADMHARLGKIMSSTDRADIDKSGDVHPAAKVFSVLAEARRRRGEVAFAAHPTRWPVGTSNELCCWMCWQLAQQLTNRLEGPSVALSATHCVVVGWTPPTLVPLSSDVLRQLRDALFDVYVQVYLEEVKSLRVHKKIPTTTKREIGWI